MTGFHLAGDPRGRGVSLDEGTKFVGVERGEPRIGALGSRRDHEKEMATETKLPARLVAVRNGKGAVIGWLQSAGVGRVNVLDRRGRVVAREIGRNTLDRRGLFTGSGNQG